MPRQRRARRPARRCARRVPGDVPAPGRRRTPHLSPSRARRRSSRRAVASGSAAAALLEESRVTQRRAAAGHRNAAAAPRPAAGNRHCASRSRSNPSQMSCIAARPGQARAGSGSAPCPRCSRSRRSSEMTRCAGAQEYTESREQPSDRRLQLGRGSGCRRQFEPLVEALRHHVPASWLGPPPETLVQFVEQCRPEASRESIARQAQRDQRRSGYRARPVCQ